MGAQANTLQAPHLCMFFNIGQIHIPPSFCHTAPAFFVLCAPLQNPAMSVAKNHHQIVLRAADASEKYEWLARLRNASDSRGGMGKAPPIAGATSQQLAQQQQGGPAAQQQGPASARRSTTGGAEAAPPEKKVTREGRWVAC